MKQVPFDDPTTYVDTDVVYVTGGGWSTTGPGGVWQTGGDHQTAARGNHQHSRKYNSESTLNYDSSLKHSPSLSLIHC